MTIDDVREVAQGLPGSTAVLAHERLGFRIGRVVWLAFSSDEMRMGFAFPREERDLLVASEPVVFLLPRASDLRYHWVEVRLAALDPGRMREIVLDAWRFVVPSAVVAATEYTG